MSASARRIADRYTQAKVAAVRGPVWEALWNDWNVLHDIEAALKQAAHEYDVAQVYKGGEAERDAEAMVKQIEKAIKAIQNLADGGGVFDDLVGSEAEFVEKHGTPEEYAAAMRDRIYPR